jgi:hypothetical protein
MQMQQRELPSSATPSDGKKAQFAQKQQQLSKKKNIQ